MSQNIRKGSTFLSLFQKDALPKVRLEALSDGIFAIILTLLILEIRLPHSEYRDDLLLLERIFSIWPQILSWISSFLMIAVFWVNHHHVLQGAKKADFGLIWLNTFFLLTISFVPFPTGVLGEYGDSPVAISFFALAIMIPGILLIAIRSYVNHFLKDGHSSSHKHTVLSLIFGPGLYGLAAIISWINLYVAYALLLFSPLYFMIPQDGMQEKSQKLAKN